MVEKRMQEDLERNPDNKFAQMLVGKVSRKVVKQTVMTTVYGVTFVGARDQIEKQLKDRGDVPLEECYLASIYLAKQVW
jgi:DNA-directed RNA polymerase